MKRLLYFSLVVMAMAVGASNLIACRGLKEKKSANHQPFSPHQYKKPQQKKH